MTELETLRALEHDFWTGGSDFYREHLASDCRMALPGVGFLSRPEVIHSVDEGPRWERVTMTGVQVRPVGDDVRMVSYRAEAARQDRDEPYQAWVSSCYTRDDDHWKLAFHQQTVIA